MALSSSGEAHATGDECRAKAAELERLVRDAPPTDHRRAFELQAAHLREIADEMDAYVEEGTSP